MALRRRSQKLPRDEWIECLTQEEWPPSKSEPGKGIAYHREIAGCHVFYMKDHNDLDVWVYHIDSRGKLPSVDGWSVRKFAIDKDARWAPLNRLADGLGKR
jgi:hypothetical protein